MKKTSSAVAFSLGGGMVTSGVGFMWGKNAWLIALGIILMIVGVLNDRSD